MNICKSILKVFDNIDRLYGLEYDEETSDNGFSWLVQPWRDDSVKEVEDLCCTAEYDLGEDWDYDIKLNAIKYYNEDNVIVGIIRVREL